MLDYIMDAIIGIFFSFTLMLIGVIIFFNNEELYYRDIDVYELEKTSQLDKEDIITNYNTLIDYLSPFSKETELVLPDFVFSENGLTHFKDVKILIKKAHIYALLSTIVFIFIIIFKIKQNDLEYYFVTSVTIIITPIILSIIFFCDFNKSFEQFHKLLFKNDYWLLDPSTDPIINILPYQYFIHCGIGILSLMLGFGSFLFIINMILEKKFGNKTN